MLKRRNYGQARLVRPTGAAALAPGAMIMILVAECVDGGTGPRRSEPSRPTPISVSPASLGLPAIGATVQLTAEVREQNGQVMTRVAVARSTNNARVATVDALGLVMAAGNRRSRLVRGFLSSVSGDLLADEQRSSASIAGSP